MVTAQHPNKTLLVAITVATVALMLPREAKATAGAPISCTVASNCVIGEYLYDDDYAPIASATCTITSRDPSGNLYLNSQAMTVNADGWYSHTFTAPSTTGLYPTQVCCTSGSDYMCLDKGFEVTSASGNSLSASDIAEAVWGYSTRTMSGFGDLISNIWDNGTRTLTKADLDSGHLATESYVKSQIDGIASTDSAVLKVINNTTRENRLLLERVVNQPIIETTLEEEAPDLTEKLTDTKNSISQVDISTQYLKSKVGVLSLRWSTLTEKELLDTMLDLDAKWGEAGDASFDTFMGSSNWLRNSWNWNQITEVADQGRAVSASIDSIKSMVGTYGKTALVKKEVLSMAKYLDTLEKLIGDSSDSTGATSLYGKWKETFDLANTLNQRTEEADKLLADWKLYPTTSLQTKISALSKKVIAVNRIPRVQVVLASSTTQKDPAKKLKNQLLGVRALVNSNRLLLAKGSGVSFSNTWLEEGSVVFKSLVTNPSTLISQDVPIKYLLPEEVKKENILEVDEGLSVDFDSEKNRYYVAGTFTLKPSESKTFSVRVDDIWDVTPEAIDSLRKQAEQLARPLEKTSYFAQGVTLKSDIDVSLDKVLALQKSTATPEQKIRAYREAQIEMKAAQEKMTKLQDLVAQAGSAGNFLGFVGGSQAIAVWGLIIMMGGGFVFLAIYMRTISARPHSETSNEAVSEVSTAKSHKSRLATGLQIGMALVLTSAITATISAVVVRKVVLAQLETAGSAVAKIAQAPAILAAPSSSEEVLGEQVAIGGEEIVRIVVPVGAAVNLRSDPNPTAPIVAKVRTTLETTLLAQEDGWVQVEYLAEPAWVSDQYVEFSPDQASAELGANIDQEVVIQDTPTGWLRVRETPGGVEIARVLTGQRYPLLDQKAGWWQIETEDGVVGWVSQEYSSVLEAE